MVNHRSHCERRGFATLELVVAIGILTSTILPVAFSVIQEQRVNRAYYYRAVAMELVDGEMEVLMAGEWRAFAKGQRPYVVHGQAAKNLPLGQFLLSIDEADVRLEWRPAKPSQGGAVIRTARHAAAEPLRKEAK